MKAVSFTIVFITLLVESGILPLKPWVLALGFVLFPLLAVLSRGSRSSLMNTLVLGLCFINGLYIGGLGPYAVGIDEVSISKIRGTLIEDSRLTDSGYTFFSLSLRSATSQIGTKLSAKGLCPAICRTPGFIGFGSEVELEGCFSDGLFVASSYRALDSPSGIMENRMRLIKLVERKFEGKASLNLALMLLLGRKTQPSPVAQSARSSGSSHVLALSGMHLGFFTLLFKRKGRPVGMALCLVFPFIAGPKASLIRAFLMLVCPVKGLEGLVISLAIQQLADPLSLAGYGGLYSYLAMLGLVCLTSYIKGLLKTSMSLFFSSALSCSIAAIVTSAVASLAIEGCFHPQAIVISYLGGLIAFAVMGVGLLYLFLPLGFLGAVLDGLYLLLNRLFELGSLVPSSSIKVYIILLTTLLTLLALLRYSRFINRKRRARLELEFRLRFSQCNKSLASSSWTEPDKEVWTELSSV